MTVKTSLAADVGLGHIQRDNFHSLTIPSSIQIYTNAPPLQRYHARSFHLASSCILLIVNASCSRIRNNIFDIFLHSTILLTPGSIQVPSFIDALVFPPYLQFYTEAHPSPPFVAIPDSPS